MKYRICISALLLWAGMQLSASNNQERSGYQDYRNQ